MILSREIIYMEHRVKIGTWNVEYAYERRLDAIRTVINANPADIWILTETHDDLVPDGCEFVAHSLPRPRNWNGIRGGSRWVSIWSRYPIVEQISLDGADEKRTVIARIKPNGSSTLLVYGTVLPWKGDEHHRVIGEQAREWRELKERYPDADLVIAGDYNTDMGTGRRYGTKRGIADLNKALDLCGLYCATAPDLLPENALTHWPIDHISIPKRWQTFTNVAAAWDANRKVHSDHSGLVLQIDPQ